MTLIILIVLSQFNLILQLTIKKFGSTELAFTMLNVCKTDRSQT